MAEPEAVTRKEIQRYAVVTGSNKGIGFEICKQLASHGIMVVLTARDEHKGIQAIQKLKGFGFSDHVVFHQLDVVDPSSITSLAQFVNTQFGRLDILVNNAGVRGSIIDGDALKDAILGEAESAAEKINWNEKTTQPYELTVQCLETNYYGAKRMIEAFIPLLQLSDSPTIVNVSSAMGILKNISNEWAKGILGDGRNLTEERVDEVVNEFVKDFKEDSLQSKGWPIWMSAYVVSKAAMNAYTRTVANKYPSFCVNCVCPGYVKTDINHNTGILTVKEGAQRVVKVALLPNGRPSGAFFIRGEVYPF